ncbi:hypothetical protein OAO01_02245 [Oligoflexia bacterium]|nr:hypothetical protein [Oligoflexia bacterium]
MNAPHFILSALINTAPLLAAPLLIWPLGLHSIIDLLEIYTLFFALFVVWKLFRWRMMASLVTPASTAPKHSTTDPPKTQQHKVITVTLFACTLLLAILFLQLFRLRASNALFYFTLFTMSLAALADSFNHRNMFKKALACIFFYYLALSYLSIILTLGKWAWQPALLSLALAANTTLHWTTQRTFRWIQVARTPLKKGSSNKKPKRKRRDPLPPAPCSLHLFTLLYPLLLVLSPLSIASLCYLKHLPMYYLVLLVTIPLGLESLNLVKGATAFDELPDSLPVRTTNLCVLFIILLLLLGLLPSELAPFS